MTLEVGLTDFMSAIWSNVKGVPVVASVEQHFKSRRWQPGKPYDPQLYTCISSVQDIPRQKVLRRREADLVETRLIVLDDVGTKVEAAEVKLPPSYILETSPNNFQWGYILKAGFTPAAAAALIEAIAQGGLTDMGSRRADRIVRVPGSLNVKYDEPFHAVMHKWEPELKFTLSEIAVGLDVVAGADRPPTELQDLPEGAVDPVFEWLDDHGMLIKGRTPNARGWVAVHCFREEEHSGDAGHGADYHPGMPGAFRCLHDHDGEQLGSAELRAWIVARDREADIGVVPKAQVTRLAQGLKKALGVAPAAAAGVVTSEGPVTDIGRLGAALRALAPQGTLFGPPPAQVDPNTESLAQLIVRDLPKVTPFDIPDPTLSQTRDRLPLNAQATTTPRVQAVMHHIGMKARLNVVTKKAEITAPSEGWPDEAPETLGDSVLKHKCATAGMTNDRRIAAALNEEAETHAYSPVEEWIKAAPWDGTSRLQALCDTLVPADPTHAGWRDTIVRKWLRQAYAAMTNWRRGDSALQVGFVLVLQGAGDIGKTYWVKRLLPDQWITDSGALHLDGANERDAVCKVTMTPITEIGELDSSFSKSEQSALKNMLTRTVDVFRLAYAAIEVRRPRGTAFVATVNSYKFLRDETGERRYWPIALAKVDSYHSIDMQQLWAEVAYKWEKGETEYRLDRVEAQTHLMIVEEHSVDNEVAHIVEDLLSRRDAGGATMRLASCRELCRHPEYDVRGATKNTWNMLANMLARVGFERHKIGGKRGFLVPDFTSPLTAGQRELLGRLGG